MDSPTVICEAVWHWIVEDTEIFMPDNTHISGLLLLQLLITVIIIIDISSDHLYSLLRLNHKLEDSVHMRNHYHQQPC
jgi:hypothetical protein